jgi:hypothetical protein
MIELRRSEDLRPIQSIARGSSWCRSACPSTGFGQARRVGGPPGACCPPAVLRRGQTAGTPRGSGTRDLAAPKPMAAQQLTVQVARGKW